ncbi:hypothetical protein R1flu_028623 [Riccia fluitans]|uniref:CRAL/TRIO N-terminal domain-containing protein n=1 Tax=Riccia fluitans TaxID=41844 RepID=A0ABD1XMB1_9MARC
MTTPKTAAAATKVEETKAAKDVATLPVAVSSVGSAEATKEVASNGKSKVSEVEKTEGETHRGSCSRKAVEAVDSVIEVAKEVAVEESEDSIADYDIFFWGVPLLHTKRDKRTDVILLKFLRARDNVNQAFKQLKKAIIWMKFSRPTQFLRGFRS